MKIALCGSMTAFGEIQKVGDQLIQMGHDIVMPKPMSDESTVSHQQTAGIKMEHDLIRGYFEKIKNCDALLVINVERKGIAGYIGGNTFLEMGFAYVLNKPIYLWGQVPKMGYADEIVTMEPILIDGDVTKIR